MTRERIEDFREVVIPFVTKRLMETNYENLGESDAKEFSKDFNKILALAIKGLEQEPQISKWCTDCSEYDQEKHCCHRWSKVIRDTVAEMKQEPILDKIRAEITAIAVNGQVDEHTMFIRAGEQVKQMALDIIDKYKAEIEPQESESDA